MPRFAVLAHDWPQPHLDLFLEAGDALRAWKLPADFSPDLPASILPNAPHRKFYLDFEGELSDDRGRIFRWDFGEFEWVQESAELLRAKFAGRRLTGLYEWAGATFRKIERESSVRRQNPPLDAESPRGCTISRWSNSDTVT